MTVTGKLVEVGDRLRWLACAGSVLPDIFVDLEKGASAVVDHRAAGTARLWSCPCRR